jgi:hypothetical protein
MSDVPIPESIPVGPVDIEQAQAPVDQLTGNQNGDDERDYRERLFQLEVWQHRFTMALVLTAIVQAGTACWQGCEMRRQSEQTEKTLALMQMEMIPSLAIGHATLEVPLEAGVELPVKMLVRNTGGGDGIITASRAIAVPVIPGTDFVDFMSTAIEPGKGIEFCSISVPEGETISFGPRKTNALIKDQVTAIERGDKTLYVILQLVYDNPFGNHDIFVCACKYNVGVAEMPIVFSRTAKRLPEDAVWRWQVVRQ